MKHLSPVMSHHRRIFINFLLGFLCLLDVFLSFICVFSQGLWWNRLFYQIVPSQPTSLLYRMGAVWFAFVLIQGYAWRHWQKKPYWLTITAGVRLTEMFSDWIYLATTDNLTWFGHFGFVISPPMNVLFAWILINSYLKLNMTKLNQ